MIAVDENTCEKITELQWYDYKAWKNDRPLFEAWPCRSIYANRRLFAFGGAMTVLVVVGTSKFCTLMSASSAPSSALPSRMEVARGRSKAEGPLGEPENWIPAKLVRPSPSWLNAVGHRVTESSVQADSSVCTTKVSLTWIRGPYSLTHFRTPLLFNTWDSNEERELTSIAKSSLAKSRSSCLVAAIVGCVSGLVSK